MPACRRGLLADTYQFAGQPHAMLLKYHAATKKFPGSYGLGEKPVHHDSFTAAAGIYFLAFTRYRLFLMIKTFSSFRECYY
jgi:hypothetical protein